MKMKSKKINKQVISHVAVLILISVMDLYFTHTVNYKFSKQNRAKSNFPLISAAAAANKLIISSLFLEKCTIRCK